MNSSSTQRGEEQSAFIDQTLTEGTESRRHLVERTRDISRTNGTWPALRRGLQILTFGMVPVSPARAVSHAHFRSGTDARDLTKNSGSRLRRAGIDIDAGR